MLTFLGKYKYYFILNYFGLTKVPMMFFAHPKIVNLDHEKVIIKIPLNWRTKNHLGSMYFGSLAIGADCAAGLYATMLIVESKKKIHLSFKNFQADFISRATEDTYFTCQQTEEIKSLVNKTIEHPNQRFNLPVTVTASCKNQIVAHFTLTLSLKMKN